MSDDQPGGINVEAGGDATVGGDAVGRDKITSITTYNYATPSAQPRRSELPHQPYFFGREEELARIADALDPETTGWGVLIDGAGGIGKTALAIRAGHLALSQHYPTKIFLSAKMRELTPHGEQPLEDFMLTNYMALLAELARELGEDEIAKGNPNERPNEVRRALSNRQALVIIDNVETFQEYERERLFLFLRRLPRSCKAIVTSRRRMDVAAEIIRLDRLKPEDAQKLIAKLSERNPLLARASEKERQQLYEITQGNPLLIEWLAAQLGRPRSQCRTIADAGRYMEAASPGNDPLEHIFGDVFNTFTENERAVLAALSHFTSPARITWIAEVAGMAETVAHTHLEDLSDRALVQGDDVAQAFVLSPLVAIFLRRRHPEVIAQTGQRLAASVYALALEGDFRDFRNYARVPVLTAQWPKIAAALPLFLQGDNARLQKLCDALNRFLNFSGHWDEWLALSLQAEARAAIAGDSDSAGRRAYNAGWVYRLRGQGKEVLDCARRGEAHWAKSNSPEKALAIRLRGKGHQLEKNYPAALAAFQEMIDFARALSPENENVAMGLNDLGWAEQEAGDLDSAERHYSEALRIATAIGYNEGIATNLGTLAGLLLEREDWPAAEALGREALQLTEAMGHQLFIAYNCWQLAKALARQGRPAEGLPYAQRAVDIFNKLPSPEMAKAQAVLKECEGVNG
jgi:tetratricopeptide (TPR) repeat protein